MKSSLWTSKGLQWVLFLSCCILAMVLRTANYEFVARNVNGHLNFIDTDCYYYLRRLVHFLENFPSLMTFDPLMDWPSGGPVDWPEGFLLLLGIPLKVAGVSSFLGLELGVCFIMVFLGLIACICSFQMSVRIFESRYLAMIVFFLASTSYLLVRFSCLGQVDHHIMEAMIPVFAFLLVERLNDQKSVGSSILIGAFMAASLLISSSSIFSLGVIFALLAYVHGSRDLVKSVAIVGVSAILFLIPYVIWSSSQRGATSIGLPSLFHILLIGTLSVITGFLCYFHQKRILVTIIGGAVLGFCYWMKWPAALVNPIESAIGYVFGRAGILSNVSEASPIFRNFSDYNFDFMHVNFGYLVWGLPAVWIACLLWSRWDLRERAFLFWLSLLSIPGIAQKRFSHLMIIGFYVFLVWIVYRLLKAGRFAFASAALILILAATLTPPLRYGLVANGTPRDRVDGGSVGALFQTAKLDKEGAWKRLAGQEPVDVGIWANPNMSHMLNYVTGYGVVTNSFYHSAGMDLDFKLRKIQSDQDFLASLKENRIKYAVLADDFLYFNLLFDLYKESNEGIVKHKEDESGSKKLIVDIKALEKYAWVRALLKDPPPPELKALFSIRFPERHFYTRVRALEMLP